jgi:hypothetical protein
MLRLIRIAALVPFAIASVACVSNPPPQAPVTTTSGSGPTQIGDPNGSAGATNVNGRMQGPESSAGSGPSTDNTGHASGSQYPALPPSR